MRYLEHSRIVSGVSRTPYNRGTYYLGPRGTYYIDSRAPYDGPRVPQAIGVPTT